MQRLRALFRWTGASLSLLLSTGLGLGAALLLGLLFWLQSEVSLEQGLGLLSRVLPAGQTLQARDVGGSLARGGRIGQLRWSQGALVVELQGLELDWDWHALRDGELRVSRLHAQLLQVQDGRPASGVGFSELPLPLRMDVQFALDRLEWAGPPALQAQGLRGQYRFDGSSHWLQDASLAIADGSYQLNGQLQATQPMALSLQASGSVQTPVQVRQTALTLQAKATLQGTLMGADAVLDLAMDLKPQESAASRPLGAMQASVQATLKPAQAQPIASAQAQWTALNLASLWPQAPQTSLSGQARVLPEGEGWTGTIQLQNKAPGTLDRQRLPLQSASATLRYGQQQWLLSALQSAVAGGTLQAQGRYAGSPAQWSVAGTLKGVQPQQIDSRWPAAVLDGTLAAEQTALGIRFDTLLAAVTRVPAQAAAQPLRLQAKGLWHDADLAFESLLLQTPQARLAGQLQLNLQSYASTAHLQALLPGAKAALDGSLAAAAGQGSSSLQVSDMQALTRWLQAIPVLGAMLPALEAQGALEFSAHWQGGWQKLGEGLTLEALAKSAQLDLGPNLALRDMQLELRGSLRALALQFASKALVGTQQLALTARSQIAQIAAGQWRARLEALQAQLTGEAQSKPWSMQLEQSVALDWQQGLQQRSLGLAAGSLRLDGPLAGQALVRWDAAQWSQPTAAAQGATAAARWNSRGVLQGVPLAWLELLGQTRLANLGLRGDLVFGGQWDARADSQGVLARASLRRTAGDLHLLVSEQGKELLAAGLRDARVEVQLEREVLQSHLVWASEAAGNADAQFSTRVQSVDGLPRWAADAPVQGQLQAKLPRVGVWSLVAPVGWRIQGTVDAQASLSGSRASPIWQGSLEARDMSMRSVVDGIDFSNGVMRLQLNGQHMEIAEFTLQGAGGASGGKLVASGAVDWLPGAVGAPFSQRLRMALEAQAQGFRVTARPDQRLVVSGKLNARLEDARLTVRGALVADQALFVLPEDTAPRLGADVRVQRPASASGKTAATPRSAAAPKTQTQPQTVVPDLNITLDPGSNFQLQGHGINTRLAGLLSLKAVGRDVAPQLTGELHTVNGTYRAYGQRLNIEEGTLRFSGAYDNPALAILAVRPNLQQVVGVQVSGTAQVPVLRLYSDPDMPDADKLSWLVLGRASANGGAETALLQQAALALLSGKSKGSTDALFSALGLDEVSIGQAATTNLDGSSGTEATVKLGKRISRDFYVAYERSLAGALGTFYVFYDLSRRFTLRGQSGAQSALDLIFTTRYD